MALLIGFLVLLGLGGLLFGVAALRLGGNPINEIEGLIALVIASTSLGAAVVAGALEGVRRAVDASHR